jgi:mono/diheme cytochrome c family protein
MRAIKFVLVSSLVPLAWAVPDNSIPGARAADGPAPSFAKDVKPFLTNYCQNCHSGRRAKAGYAVDSYAGLVKNGKRGPMVVPGKPEESRLLMTLTGRAKRMPPKNSDQPTAEEVAKVRAWIKSGAKEDSPADGKARDGE